MDIPKKVTIHNKISENYRQIHVDGAYGGLTTKGLINLSFFGERTPIPKSSDFEITEDGKLGGLINDSPESKKGILREYEFGIYCDIPTAKAMIKLLTEKIEMLENFNDEKK